MLSTINEYRKAIAAFLVPALTVLGASLNDGTITSQEWITIAIAALGTSIAVGIVPNQLNETQVINAAKHLPQPGAIAAQLISNENRRTRNNTTP